jgi:hypothetical protein
MPEPIAIVLYAIGTVALVIAVIERLFSFGPYSRNGAGANRRRPRHQALSRPVLGWR